MKRNRQDREQKKLRKELVEYLAENRKRSGFDPHWSPGDPRDYRVSMGIKAKIGAGNMSTKGVRKWNAVNHKLDLRRERYKPINPEEDGE